MSTRIKIKKGLLPKNKRFWCWRCGGFTKSKPLLKRGHQYGMQCLTCRHINADLYYDCPKCGAEHDQWEMECTKGSECDKEYSCSQCEYQKATSLTLIELGESSYNHGASMEGGSCYDWTETHKCWNCGTKYEFDNSNC